LCPMLTSLNLAHNHIQGLPQDLPAALPRLTSLDLTYNRSVGLERDVLVWAGQQWAPYKLHHRESRELFCSLQSMGPWKRSWCCGSVLVGERGM
jgi:hypothetical protein